MLLLLAECHVTRGAWCEAYHSRSGRPEVRPTPSITALLPAPTEGHGAENSSGNDGDEQAPDVYVTFYAGSHIKEAKSGVGYAPWDLVGYGMLNIWTSEVVPGSTPSTWVNVQGMLLFEIADANTGGALYSSMVTKKIKNPGRMPKDVDKTAAEIAKAALKDFPPGAKGK